MATSTPTKRRQSLDRWTDLLGQHLPSLFRPEAKGLALWSIGIVLARSCSLHAVVLALSCWLSFNPLSLRRRLQEWYYEAAAKKGHGSGAWGVQRRDWDPNALSADLLAWILEDWPGHQLVLALDPTNLGDRFTVLNISVLYRGCAVPVIWTVVEGGEPGAWEPHWERMLRILAGRVPAGWQVLVLTDRGMYSPRLFRCLVELHWHPFLRIRAQGFYRPIGSQKWLDLKDLRPQIGETRGVPGRGLQERGGAAGVYAGGLPRGGLCRAVADRDRSGSGGSEGQLVRAAGLDRAGVQAGQRGRLEVAADADPRLSTVGAAVAGGGRGDDVGAEGRWRGGGGRADGGGRGGRVPERGRDAALAGARSKGGTGEGECRDQDAHAAADLECVRARLERVAQCVGGGSAGAGQLAPRALARPPPPGTAAHPGRLAPPRQPEDHPAPPTSQQRAPAIRVIHENDSS